MRDVSLSPELPAFDSFATLADTKLALGANDNAQDAALTRLLGVASQTVEQYCGGVILQRTVTEYVYPEDAVSNVVLSEYPAISLTSVTIDDVAQTVGNYRIDKQLGAIRAKDGSTIAGREVLVVYEAGYAAIPAGVSQATIELVRFLNSSPNRMKALLSGIKSESVEGVGSATYASANDVPMMSGANGVSLPVDVATYLIPFARSFAV